MGRVNYGTQGATGFTLTFPAKRAVQQSTGAVARAMQEIARKMQTGIKSITPVDTGRLQRSVSVKGYVGGAKRENPRIEVRTVDYGQYVEFGTHKMAAQPYIRPIIQGNRQLWERELRKRARELSRAKKKR